MAPVMVSLVSHASSKLMFTAATEYFGGQEIEQKTCRFGSALLRGLSYWKTHSEYFSSPLGAIKSRYTNHTPLSVPPSWPTHFLNNLMVIVSQAAREEIWPHVIGQDILY